MRVLVSRAALVVLLLSASTAAWAQLVDRYRIQYGEPVDVTLDMLVSMPEFYAHKAVRTSGRLETFDSSTHRLSRLGAFAHIVPVPEIANRFLSDAQSWLGREIEVTGIVNVRQSAVGSVPTITSLAAPESPRACV